MKGNNIKQRSKAVSIDIGHLALMLPYTIVNRQYIAQIVRSSSSIAANYRAAMRAKSDRDFVNKLKICEEETDETQLWLELLAEFNQDFRERIIPLYKECDELLSIFIASIKTMRNKMKSTVAEK